MTVPPTRADIVAAHDRLLDQVRRTPILDVDGASLALRGHELVLKLEFVQHSGSFKARGACNFIAMNNLPSSGVVAASGGNHGAAVAWAARREGVPAAIFVPTIASQTKVARLREYGADVHQVGAVYSESFEASEQHRAATGAMRIHAYDDPDVMAGAGTTGLEFVAQAGRLDSVLVACGGGGLSGGMGAAIGDTTRIVVVETDTTNTYAAALQAGEPVDVEVGGLTADALGATRLGGLAWQALSSVDAVSVVVTDDEVVLAMAHLWSEFRIAVEPAAAVTAAALLSGRFVPHHGERVGVVICAANTTIT